MADTEFIQIRVNTADKERWKDAVETNTQYRDLTHLIVTAVEGELSTDTETSSQPPQSVSVDFDGVNKRLDTLQSNLSRVEDTVETIKLQTDNRKEIRSIAATILQYLPEGTTDDIQGEVETDLETEVRVRRYGRKSDIQSLMQTKGDNTYDVERALEMLEASMETVTKVTAYGDTRYVKHSP